MKYIITIEANNTTINKLKCGFNIKCNKSNYLKFKFNGDIIEFLDYMYDNKLKYNKLILKQY